MCDPGAGTRDLFALCSRTFSSDLLWAHSNVLLQSHGEGLGKPQLMNTFAITIFHWKHTKQYSRDFCVDMMGHVLTRREGLD